MSQDVDHPRDAGPRVWGRRWLRLALFGAGGAGAVIALRGRLPDAGAVFAVVVGADLRWVAAAVLAQILSQVAYGGQQRRLLQAFASVVTLRRAVAIAVTRSAISMALPGGPAVAAAYAARQYRRHGVSPVTAATVAVLSGLVPLTGLLVLYATVILVSWLATLPPAGALAATVAAAALGTVVVARLQQHRRGDAPAPRRSPRGMTSSRATAALLAAVRQARTITRGDWVAVMALAVVNSLLDMATLGAMAAACKVTVGPVHLAGIFLAAQLARQIPITPGGLGLVEAGLLAGLTATGAAAPAAAAVVLGYRLVSFWLMLPLGVATYVVVRRTDESSSPVACLMPER